MTTIPTGYTRHHVEFDLDVWGDRDVRAWDWPVILADAVGEDPDMVVENSLTITDVPGPLEPGACEIQFVYDHAVVYQDATITPEGNVAPRGEIMIHKVGDTYVWCETHQVALYAGGQHMNLPALNDEWESV